ncbi:MAG: ammonium transporter [Spirochaetales bacterium]|nr:ammonium transporter [Spirochaetales bacterium]
MLVLFAFCAATAIAQDAAPAAPAAAGEKVPVDPGGTSADFIWLLVSAFLVFFMQAGFAMVETGFTRAKNATNILMKNLLDFSIGSLVFFFIGWGFMYGQDVLGVLGITDFAVTSADPGKAGGYYQYATWLFQVVFAATAATIVSGAMAERTKFKSYLIYSVVISAIIYPVTGHWIWNPNGWLAKLNFLDFAGSTVVHSVGGWLALTGAVVLGPRIGKYGPDGRPKAIAGHNIPLAALGVFILWLGWFGFNPGSTLKFADNIGHIAVTTNLSAAAGAVSALITIWIISKKPDASMALNGVLAGLVAVTAPCANVSPVSAVVIGLLAGVLVVLSVLFVDRVLKIDDPVGAISVHGVCGVFGTLAVGLFAEPQYNNGLTGLFFGGGFHQLGVQALGIASVAVYVLGLGFALFFILKKTVGLRVSKTEELKGLDIDEHGMEAYSGFQILD